MHCLHMYSATNLTKVSNIFILRIKVEMCQCPVSKMEMPTENHPFDISRCSHRELKRPVQVNMRINKLV